MTDLPFISCLCPTYRRPRLLANSVACFLAQDYPRDRRELIILDDGGDFESQQQDNWQVISISRRFNSLPEKFNALAGLAAGDVLAVWEDDDVYLPWHLTAHACALEHLSVSKPSRVISTYPGHPIEENAEGRFHASIAFAREAFINCGGWPLTNRADFDQQLLQRLSAVSEIADPCVSHSPSYVFRWATTGTYHAQSLMTSPDDEKWYERWGEQIPTTSDHPGVLFPELDRDTRSLLAVLNIQSTSLVEPVHRQSHVV